MLQNSNRVGPVLFGEAKEEDKKDDLYFCLMGLLFVLKIHQPQQIQGIVGGTNYCFANCILPLNSAIVPVLCHDRNLLKYATKGPHRNHILFCKHQ